MFIEQFARLWAQITSTLAIGLTSKPRINPKRASSTHGETSSDEAVGRGLRTEPYAPARSEWLSESSLHLSC